MYIDKDGLLRWDNDMYAKTTEGLKIPETCQSCGANLAIEFTVGVVVRCNGPSRHFYGVLDNPIKSIQGQREVNL